MNYMSSIVLQDGKLGVKRNDMSGTTGRLSRHDKEAIKTIKKKESQR